MKAPLSSANEEGRAILNEIGEYEGGIAKKAPWILDAVSAKNPLFSNSMPDANRVSAEPADQMRAILQEKRPRSLVIHSDAATAVEAIPDFLAQMPQLRALSLPSQIAPSLLPGMIGPYVKALKFYGTYDKQYWNNKTVILSSEAPFTSIEALSGTAYCYRIETRFRFDPAIFPHLRSLGFTFDTKQRFAETLHSLRHLIAVSVAGFDTLENLADMLPCRELISLTLARNSKIETLRGIEHFPNLRYLKLVSLTKLTSLDAIAPLQHLEFVGIYWSKRVERAEALLELPALKKIAAFGNDSKKPIWQRLKQESKARGLDCSDL